MWTALRQVVQQRGDQLLALGLTGIALVDIALDGAQPERSIIASALALVLGYAAAIRVRAPLILLGLIFVMSVGWAASEALRVSSVGSFMLFVILAVYSAAAHATGRSARLGGVMVIGIYLCNLAGDPRGIYIEGLVFSALLVGGPWFAGRSVRQRRMKERLLESERARAARAVEEERARIARELHDVVAHAISIMVVQARGGRRVLDAAPDEASEAFDAIERTGHQALDEMRRLLGLLRRSDERAALTPQPRLRELPGLIAQVGAAGLSVELVVEGDPRDLPPGVELSAYRIVQEALTNALRHGGPGRARVTVRYGAEDLELEIADDGVDTVPQGGPGYGLRGMQERVSVYGGALEAGPRSEGGYQLRVRLPVGSVRA